MSAKNPSALTLGLTYNPVPLVTFGLDRSKWNNGQSEVKANIMFNYRLNVPLSKQLDPHMASPSRNLMGSRYNPVERNNNITLEYKAQDSISFQLPSALKGVENERRNVSIDVKAQYGLERIDWDDSALVPRGGKVIALSNSIYQIQIPTFDADNANQFIVTAVAYDRQGYASNRSTMTIYSEPAQKLPITTLNEILTDLVSSPPLSSAPLPDDDSMPLPTPPLTTDYSMPPPPPPPPTEAAAVPPPPPTPNRDPAPLPPPPPPPITDDDPMPLPPPPPPPITDDDSMPLPPPPPITDDDSMPLPPPPPPPIPDDDSMPLPPPTPTPITDADPMPLPTTTPPPITDDDSMPLPPPPPITDDDSMPLPPPMPTPTPVPAPTPMPKLTITKDQPAQSADSPAISSSDTRSSNVTEDLASKIKIFDRSKLKPVEVKKSDGASTGTTGNPALDAVLRDRRMVTEPLDNDLDAESPVSTDEWVD
ncbi:inverse autotransporter beta domain-containing protein [Sodalis ligni]|nr:inverse autotransporter beta domain-containing protein [Sodalis ligni]